MYRLLTLILALIATNCVRPTLLHAEEEMTPEQFAAFF